MRCSVVFVALLLLLAIADAAAAGLTISLADANALDLNKASIIDVRYASDYRRGHIKGAVCSERFKGL